MSNFKLFVIKDRGMETSYGNIIYYIGQVYLIKNQIPSKYNI